MMPLRFWVAGKPQTAGSKSPIPTKAGLRVIEAGSKRSRAAKRSWRGDLRDAALTALERQPHARVDGAVDLTIVIVRKRPSDHMRTGRNAGVVKDWAQRLLPTARPDTVKLVRAAEDALTGVVWADDSQIVRHQLYKVFGDQAGLSWDAEGMFICVAPASGYFGPMVGLFADARVAA